MFPLLGDINDTVVCVGKEIHRSQPTVAVTVEYTVLVSITAKDTFLVDITVGCIALEEKAAADVESLDSTSEACSVLGGVTEVAGNGLVAITSEG